jgi:hypothetical protein
LNKIKHTNEVNIREPWAVANGIEQLERFQHPEIGGVNRANHHLKIVKK